MLVVGLRSPINSLLKNTWVYNNLEVLPYEFGLGSSLITVMTILISILIAIKWMNNRVKAN